MLYIVSTEENYLFHDMYGMGGVMTSLLIGNILVEPNGTIYKNVQYRILLLPYVATYILLSLFPLDLNDFLLVITSFFISFLYLRRRKPASTFAVAEDTKLDILFPSGLRAAVKARCGYSIFGGAKKSGTINESHLPATLPKVIVSDPVGERRRARALQALDRKLAEISREPEVSLDGNDDDVDIVNKV
mmetsp:Transcript_20314/g.25949  ORF Transcript_20314/g.25949 Transcript_20314/m.25949 type:complete len:189 (-) Transcript_20314:1244-1810(-)